MLVGSPLPALAQGFSPWLLLLITATAVINFTNFMDGLVAGCMAVTFAVELKPPKVFMGDVGSTPFLINSQWRLCFRWSDAGPTGVEIVDYHKVFVP